MRGLPRILSLIRDKLNKFNNTGARLIGSIYCMAIKLLLNRVKKLRAFHLFWLHQSIYNYMRNHNGRHYIAIPKM